MRVLDLFSCIGLHADGLHAAGSFETIAFVEKSEWRRAQLARRYPGVPIHDDVASLRNIPAADLVIGGPPCQRSSVAAAIHGYRTGESLWPYMLHIGLCSGAEWFVVEQPPGNAAWEAEVACSLSAAGRHVARFEFAASDVGAPYPRRRVFMVASTSLPRLEIARRSLPPEIDRLKRAADAGAGWDADQLAALPVDARSAGEMDPGASAERKQWIEALGDSNPPQMMTAIGRAILAAAEH